jgi:cryptochrome
MGYSLPETPRLLFPGGEEEGLRRLHSTVTSRPEWVNAFEKPNTVPNMPSAEPSTTALSPYLKFGCVSARLVYAELMKIKAASKRHSEPPVSLQGQLLWREFFYYCSFRIHNFGRMEGNAQCRQIPWARDKAMVSAWELGRTGYPFIDAIMNQLRAEGWIHHLARHAVACFLTRGDLWQHWEEGARVFDYYLLDSDWALNNANWQWLSCSNFFHQYFRVYSPVAFGKKTDKDGHYIRKWVPELAQCPSKYIYEPWTAPLSVQREHNFVVGTDYPERIVIHEIAMKQNMDRMKQVFDMGKLGKTEAGAGSSAVEIKEEESTAENDKNKRSSKKQDSSYLATAGGEKRGRKRVITEFFKQEKQQQGGSDERDDHTRKRKK